MCMSGLYDWSDPYRDSRFRFYRAAADKTRGKISWTFLTACTCRRDIVFVLLVLYQNFPPSSFRHLRTLFFLTPASFIVSARWKEKDNKILRESYLDLVSYHTMCVVKYNFKTFLNKSKWNNHTEKCVIEKFYRRGMSFFIEIFVENHEKSQFRN